MITTITQNLGKFNQIQKFKFVINQKSLDTKVTGFTIQFDDFYFQTLSLNLKTFQLSWTKLFPRRIVGYHEIYRFRRFPHKIGFSLGRCRGTYELFWVAGH